ncbi:MAG: hypothetical protein CMA63_06695 [Euryarchaeota archaeon]|nr:hypothetical protein [Euryarchaeota archaeon]|tara:strand:- start:4375 stop:4629 length:255 start_codon:yes stop_codon:yes gene_type:complete
MSYKDLNANGEIKRATEEVKWSEVQPGDEVVVWSDEGGHGYTGKVSRVSPRNDQSTKGWSWIYFADGQFTTVWRNWTVKRVVAS